MKKTSLPLAIFVLFLLSCAEQPTPSAAINSGAIEEQMTVNKPLTASEAHLGEHMSHMQYYMLKLGLAIKEKNIPLAKFYVQEVDEVAEDISKMNIIDNELELSVLLESMLIPQVNVMIKELDSDNTSMLGEKYNNVIAACNSCHAAAKKEFIVIEEPSQPFNGQRFKPMGIN